MTTNQRQTFFELFEKSPKQFGPRMPFFPDITDWYMAHRVAPGGPQPFGPGQFIPDSAEIHQGNNNMPELYRDMTLLDIYKHHGWGFPVHIYDWREFIYHEPVRQEKIVEEGRRITRLHTPKGTLERVDLLAEDGSYTPHVHYVKELKDLEVLQLALEHQEIVPRYDIVQSVLDEMDGQGVGDVTFMRCPFGKLIQEYMGFQSVVFALYDEPQLIMDFMAFQEEFDLKEIELAANSPAKVVIISDHADENLIAPPHYEEYCIPFYNKACDILHEAGKIVSTHLDGNFKGHFPALKKFGFDLLDGTTPAPMNNWEVEELAEAMPENQRAYVGVPATLFCQSLPAEEIVEFGERIFDSFKGRGLLNVGDILPPNGDIAQVVALGERIQELNG